LVVFINALLTDRRRRHWRRRGRSRAPGSAAPPAEGAKKPGARPFPPDRHRL